MSKKPPTRPTEYERVPRQSESFSKMRLTLPILPLVTAYVPAFGIRAVKRALASPPAVNIDDILRDQRIDPDQIDLEQYFFHLRPRSVEVVANRSQLERLATSAEDYADDAGSWRAAADRYQATAAEALSKLRRGILSAIAAAQAVGGAQASLAILRRLEKVFSALQTAAHIENWSTERSRKLREVAIQLRGISRPRGWKGLALRLFPGLPCRFWLDQRQLTTIESTRNLINSAAQHRHQALASAAQQHILAELLGSSYSDGLFQQLEQNLPDPKRLLAAIEFAMPKPSPAIAAGRFEILLVSSIYDHIDEQGTTVEQFLDEIAARFGWTAKRLAERFWRDGITVRGRLLRPGDWHMCAASDLAKAVIREVRRALGIISIDAPARVDDPQTAYDVFTTTGLTNPRFEHSLRSRLPELAHHARPYFVAPQIAGTQPLGNVYLHCAPRDRGKWLELLAPYGCRPQEADGHFDLPHGAIAMLSCYSHGIVGQADPAFIRGVWLYKRRRARGEPVLPIDDRAGELRMLSERPFDHEDTEAIWQALQRSKSVRQLANGRWTLSTFEPSLQQHFYHSQLVPLAQTARCFQLMLRHKEFISFAEVHFGLGSSWAETALRLADAPSAESVAAKLVDLGVLSNGSHHSYMMAGDPPANTRGVPEGLYRWQFGELKGLTEGEFHERLRDNDWFYCVAFYRILDAWMLGELSQADTTPFMRWYRATYLL
jgi:hypothetical protein